MTAKSVMRNMNSKKAKTIIIVVGIVVCVLLGMLIYRKAEVFLILRRRGLQSLRRSFLVSLKRCRSDHREGERLRV